MSDYFDYQNPPPSRDTQKDLARLRDHFERLIAMRTCEQGCNGCEECCDDEPYECSCTGHLRPECDGVGCAAERANDERRRAKERLMGGVL